MLNKNNLKIFFLLAIILITSTACKKTRKKEDSSKVRIIEKEEITTSKAAIETTKDSAHYEKKNKIDEDKFIKQENFLKKIELQNLNADFLLDENEISANLIMDSEQINSFNKKNFEIADMLYDLELYPSNISRSDLVEIIKSRSIVSKSPRYKKDGKAFLRNEYDDFIENINYSKIPENVRVKYAMTTNRTIMRSFPTNMQAASKPGNIEFDRFTETAVYPAEPLLVLHESRDKKWYFVQMYNYNGWVKAEDIAFAEKSNIFEYTHAENFAVITEPKTNITYINEGKSQNVNIDMGTKLAIEANAQTDKYILVKLPVRKQDGNLVFKNINIEQDKLNLGYLKYNLNNIIKQSFKFAGETYGWGGLNLSRDCSAFIMDVFRTFGLKLPRNSFEQGKHSLGNAVNFSKNESIASRKKKMDKLSPGAALYMPGHVMLYLGKNNNNYYVIHSFTGYYENGQYIDMMRVGVTDLDIKSYNGKSYLERIYAAKQFNIN